MPSSQDLTGSNKRSSLSSRTSPSSAQSVRSQMNDVLSTSAQARRPNQRHVASSRLGPRAPSFNRNLNKLPKQTAANVSEEPSSPRPGNVKRNSSITHLNRNSSSTALKKTFSETSLVRNKSSTNLTKNKSSTHLPRVASSRHVAKGSRAQFVRSRRSVSQATTAQRGTSKNDVRFDLDSEQAEIEGDVAEAKRAELSDEDHDEDEDEEDDNEEDQAPLTPAEEARVNQVPEEDESPSPKQPPPAAAPNGKRAPRDTIVQFRFPQPQSQMYAQPAKVSAASPASATSPKFALKVSNEGGNDTTACQQPSATPLQTRSDVAAEDSQSIAHVGRDTDADSITSRLLKRNQSSGRVASQPIISDAEAIFKGVAHPERLSPKPIELSTPNASGQDLVSRFISISGGSSTNTPRNSHSLTKATPEDEWTEIARRNQSLTDVRSSHVQHQQHQHRRSDSLRSGMLTPSQQPPSRTQQKLWLERDLSNIESQQGRQPAFLRPNRSFALGLGAGLYPGNSEVRLSQPQQRQFHDQSSIEYRRIRLFQHPLAQGVTRLQEAGVTPRTKAPSRASSTKSGLFGGGSASNEKANGLSQSWNSRKHAATATPVPRPVEHQSRRKVTFQGLKSPEDNSPRKSLDEDEEGHHRGDRDEARDVCRRMWELPAYASGD